MEKSNEILGKTGKSGKYDSERLGEKLPFDTKIEPSKTGKLPVTELTKMLFEFQAKWGKGQVNSSNDIAFSLQFVETHKPQWQANGETGYYTPSAIKGIVDKIFKITPQSTPATLGA